MGDQLRHEEGGVLGIYPLLSIEGLDCGRHIFLNDIVRIVEEMLWAKELTRLGVLAGMCWRFRGRKLIFGLGPLSTSLAGTFEGTAWCNLLRSVHGSEFHFR